MQDNSLAARQVHDLKNYLGVIVGFAELLMADFRPDDPHHADLQEVHSAALQALQIVRELSAGQTFDS